MRLGLLFIVGFLLSLPTILVGQYSVDFRDGVQPAGWTTTSILFKTVADGYAHFTDLSSVLTSPALIVDPGATIEFSVAKFGNGTNGPITVEVSDDNGVTWTAQTFDSPTPNSSQPYLTSGPTALAVSGEIIIRFTRASSFSAKRFRDLEITGAVLPIQLSKFNAISSIGQVNLEWATTTEENNRHFSIERSSDGRRFSEIGLVNGVGNSASDQTYEFLDRNPTNGMNYYRLIQVDYDGASEIYGPLAVEMEREIGSTPSVYPNPAGEFVNISGELADDTQVTLLSITGQVISTAQFGLTKNGNVGNIDVSQLKSGIYFLRFENGEYLETVRFVKQ